MMDLSDLRVFCAVAQTGGVTRAAERLHRVPSNVTTRLRQLEEDLGAQLFLRTSKRMTITPAGQLLLSYAEQILGLAQEARDALKDPTPRGTLRVGSMESTAATRLSGPLADYHKRYPLVSLELSTGPTRQLLAQVLNGELDVAFVADPVDNDRLDSHLAFKEELVLVAEAGHRRIRSPQDLHTPCMLAFRSGCTYRRKLETWFVDGGVEPSRVVELASYHAILGCAVAGMGVALVPHGLLEIFPDRDRLSVHSMPINIRRSKTMLIWRKGAASTNVHALFDLVATQVPSIAA